MTHTICRRPTIFTREVSTKRLEILRDALPQLRQVAVLVYPAGVVAVRRDMERAANLLKLTLLFFDVRGPREIESAYAAMSKAGVQAVAFNESPALNASAKLIAQLAAKARLPSIGTRGFAAAGGLMSYGVDSSVQFRRAAYFVDKILKGAKPGDIPIERATRFETVVNLKTAKALGITIPPIVMVRADRVIE